MAAAFIFLLSLCTPHTQRASITLPANSRVTVLVPSESAIRRLSPEDQAFWLQPRMLPHLVRWAGRARLWEGAFVQDPALPQMFSAWHVSTFGDGAQSQRSL